MVQSVNEVNCKFYLTVILVNCNFSTVNADQEKISLKIIHKRELSRKEAYEIQYL